MKKEEEDIRKRFRVIQGGKPDVKSMRNMLPRQFKNLKSEINEVRNLTWQPIEEIKRIIEEYELEYGIYLEEIHFENPEIVEQIYENINNHLMPYIRQAKRIQENEKRKREKNIGKEPGE